MNAERQGGVVLLSVLLVMALTLMLVAGMLRGHQVAVTGVAQQARQLQLWHLALAGEALARQRLAQAPVTATSPITHLGQAWSVPQRFRHEDAEVRVTLEDLSGRFNLNALTRAGQVDTLTLQRWQQLRESLAIEALPAELFQGRVLLSLEQLRVLPGVDRELLQRLRPWVTLLPDGAGLNVNTLSTSLLARLEGLQVAALQPLFQQRPAHGWASVQQFAAEPLAQRLGIASHGLSVASRWFAAHVEVHDGGQVLHLYSELHRDPQSARIRVVRRTLSRLGEQGR